MANVRFTPPECVWRLSTLSKVNGTPSRFNVICFNTRVSSIHVHLGLALHSSEHSTAPSVFILIDKKINLSKKQIHKFLKEKRYPVLSVLKKRIACALDEMKLDEKTRLKYQESFENDEIQLELKFRDERELARQVEKIFQALQSGSIEKLITIIKS